jgi:hypothetical protein
VPVYELTIATTSTTAGGTPIIEILSSRAASILELGLTLASNAMTWDLRRPANTPVGGTPVNASGSAQLEEGVSTSALGLIVGGWSTAPTGTGGGNFLVAERTPADTGALMGWLPGQMVVGPTRDLSLIIFAQTTPVVNNRIYVRWEE